MRLRQAPMSFEALSEELLHAQSSIVRDVSSGMCYSIPSNISDAQKVIYQTFGLKHSSSPRLIT
ncbi:hypothetical protein MCHI_000970 [Candidatus Magnetoovum chiemensis]|nr:hypothetical protein MCHI_000970 [Candidatus Magnetoovum chiemensis]